jgi:thioredoxin reductase (NADPH)
MYDIAVIGKGPAGISAAINAKARNKNVIIFGKDSRKISVSHSIWNYPGFKQISGPELIERLNDHLSSVSADCSQKQVSAIYSMGDYFSIQAEGEMFEAKKVILATGVDFKKTLEGEDTFLGRGVSYCATCDAPLYRGKVVAAIGYNQESIAETEFLSGVCSKVYFVPVGKVSGSFSSNVEVIESPPLKFVGKSKAEKLVLKNSQEIEADGFFVLKDSYPLTSLVPGLEVDGPHVKVDSNMETNIKGLYAAGDVTGKPYQIAKAAGAGQIAALNAAENL